MAQYLTDARIRATAPQAQRFILWDAPRRSADGKSNGLGLCITPNNARSWKLSYRVDGVQRWYTLGRYPRVGIAAARKAAQEVQAQIAAGRDPQAEKVANRKAEKARRAEPTVAEVVDRYFAWLEEANAALEANGEKPRDVAQKQRHLRRTLLPLFGKQRFRHVEPATLANWYDERHHEAPSAASGELSTFSAVYRWAAKNRKAAGLSGKLVSNPTRDLQRVKSGSRGRNFKDAEIRALWRAFSEEGDHGRALALGLLTGQRPGECRLISWDDIEHEDHGAWWTQPAALNKAGLRHRVWLTPRALGLLGEPGTGRVWPELKRGVPSDVVKRIRDETGVADFRPHGLRHTVSSRLASLDVSLDTVDRVVGHVLQGVRGAYQHHGYDREKARALAKLDYHLARLIGLGGTGKVVALR